MMFMYQWPSSSSYTVIFSERALTVQEMQPCKNETASPKVPTVVHHNKVDYICTLHQMDISQCTKSQRPNGSHLADSYLTFHTLNVSVPEA